MFHRGPGGLPIPGRRKKRGIGLGTIAAVGGIFAFTGLGGYVIDTVQSLKAPCHQLMNQVGLPHGACNMFGDGVQRVSNSIPDMDSLDVLPDFSMPNNMRQFTRQLDQLVDTQAFQSAIGPDLAKYVDVDAVRQLDVAMGGTLDQALSETQKLSMALSQTALGNGMLGGQFGQKDPQQAVQWYEQGASMGEYGILSQLSLGNMYAGGQHTAPDFGRAEHFYGETLKSLDVLQKADTGEARALLRSLPTDPETLKAQLEQQMSRLKAR